MCGCTNKSNTTQTIQLTTQNILGNNNRSLNMSKVATFQELENLYNQFPTEFVLANYDNGSNFRYAKSINGGLIKYGFNYYGVFSGIKQIHVHKLDVNNTNIKKVETERSLNVLVEEPKEVELLEDAETDTVDTSETIENVDVFDNIEIVENKSKRKRSKNKQE